MLPTLLWDSKFDFKLGVGVKIFQIYCTVLTGFFFAKKKTAVELCKILAKKNPDEIKTGDFYFREYEILNAYTRFQLLFTIWPRVFSLSGISKLVMNTPY